MARVLLVGPAASGDRDDRAVGTAIRASIPDHDVVALPSGPSTYDAIRAVARADAVVFSGCTLFSSRSTRRRSPTTLRHAAAIVALARIRRIPVALVGVGAGELRRSIDRRLSRWIVSHADLVVLRDEESAAVLTDAGVPAPFWIGADPSWTLMRDEASVASVTDPRRSTVAIVHGAPSSEEPASADDDVVISGQAHIVMAAAAAGRRLVAVADDPQLTGLARRLDQVSIPAPVSSAVLTSAVRWAVEHAPPSPGAVACEIDLADRTLRLLRLLLEGGQLEQPQELAALQLSDGAGRW